MCWALLARHFWMVGHQHHGLQSVQLVAEHLALLGKGNPLLHRRPDPKELAHFIEGTAEARCRGHADEPTHGVIALLDATVILLQSIVEGAVGPVEHVTAQGLADGTRVGVMPIGRHPFWGVTNHLDGLLEKALSSFHISLLTQQRVNQVAIPIDGAIQITPFPFDVDVGLINVPGSRLFVHVVWPAVGRR